MLTEIKNSADESGLELGVRYLLEGCVQRTESRLRISVQLSDSLTGHCLWIESYDRQLEDIFDAGRSHSQHSENSAYKYSQPK